MRYLNPPSVKPPSPKPKTSESKGGKKHYYYSGVVVLFGREVAQWKGGTTAVSEAKARNNLCYQARRDLDLPLNSPIQLPGRIVARNS